MRNQIPASGSGRFYPEWIPPFEGEPKITDFVVSSVNETKGQGVIAQTSFDSGHLLFVFAGVIVSEITQYSLQITDDCHVHDPFFMGKVLHSCDPNAECDVVRREFRAVRPIAAGAIITMDYESTEDLLFKPFECACGAPACRGWIAGRAFRKSAHQHGNPKVNPHESVGER